MADTSYDHEDFRIAFANGRAETDPRHTPGPWEDAGSGDVIRTKHSGGVLVAQFWTRPSVADRALIVAAPELLEALSALVQRFEVYAGPNDMHAGHHDVALLVKARAALAKAGGRS